MPIQFAALIAPYGIRHCMSPTDPAAHATELELAGRRLPHRAETQHVTAQPVGDRHHRVEDRRRPAPAPRRRRRSTSARSRNASSSGGDAALAEADLVAHPARIGGDAVDVVGRQTGVGDRREAGVDGERQRVAHQPAAEVGTADPRDHRLVLVAVVGQREPHGRPCRFDDPVDRIESRRSARTAGSTRPSSIGGVLEQHAHLGAHLDVVGLDSRRCSS